MVLEGLVIADDPAAWRELGVAVDGDVLQLGGVAIRLAGRGAGEGITGWFVRGLESDVLPGTEPIAEPAAGEHPNGVVAIDHVVATTQDMRGTMAALAAAGLHARRVRDVPGGEQSQAFYVLGTALLELAGPVQDGQGARFWGLTLVADDLDGLAERLGDRVGAVKDAVQPGRRIVTLRREAGLSLPVAFMTPR
jgi:hypothetical protein